MNALRDRPALLTAAVLMTVATVVVLLVVVSGPSPQTHPSSGRLLVAAPTGPPAQYFAALRRRAGPDDAMPQDARVQLDTLGVPVSSARSVDVGKQTPGWLMASDDQLCLAVPYAPPRPGGPGGFGSVCAPAGTVDSEGLSDVRVKDPPVSGADQQVLAVLPDDVDSVTVSRSSGDTEQVPVRGNVVVVSGTVGDHVYYRDRHGEQHDLASARTGR